MAKSVKLLIRAQGPDKGAVITQRDVDHEWSRLECPPHFVQVRVDGVADDVDFSDGYEYGQHLVDSKDGLVVVRDCAHKWALPVAKVDELLRQKKQTTIEEKDLVDKEPV